jgi:integrase
MPRKDLKFRADLGLDLTSMSKSDFNETIIAANQRLKASQIPVQIRLNGKVLGLRATLPVKPGKGTGRRQQDIRLGIPASIQGLAEVERKARELATQMVHQTFSWDKWQRTPFQEPDTIPASQVIEQFKRHYQQHNEVKDSTWSNGWGKTFKRLPQDVPLDEVIMLAVIETTEAHTETRKRTCQRLQALADYAGLKVDLSFYAGKYGRKSLTPRDIPDDEVIIQWRDRVPSLAWRWVYGMMATFGLRPHEVFFCEFNDEYSVKISAETKTGSRIAYAVRPEWVAKWNLMEVIRPKVTGKTPSDYGSRNKRQFQRYKIPFPAYNLRHAYAVRVSALGDVSTAIAARWMGHSESVHIATYHYWIKDQVSDDVYRRRVLKKLD